MSAPTVEGWVALMEAYPADGWDGAAEMIAYHNGVVVRYERELDALGPDWRERDLPYRPRTPRPESTGSSS